MKYRPWPWKSWPWTCLELQGLSRLNLDKPWSKISIFATLDLDLKKREFYQGPRKSLKKIIQVKNLFLANIVIKISHLKAFSIFMTLQILFVTYFSYLENCKRLKTWYQKIKITVASVQIIEENLFQWVHCKYLQGVILAYFTYISLQLLLTFNWESEIHRFYICSVLSHVKFKHSWY